MTRIGKRHSDGHGTTFVEDLGLIETGAGGREWAESDDDTMPSIMAGFEEEEEEEDDDDYDDDFDDDVDDDVDDDYDDDDYDDDDEDL
jgi:hypothetical protein